MKRPSKKLASSLEHRLSGYALAASAAGVSLLALTQPAEARVVYTGVDRAITPYHHYYLKLDGLIDFVIVDYINCSKASRTNAAATPPRPFRCNGYLTGYADGVGNGIEGTANVSSFDASALHRGAEIGPNRAFHSRAVMCDVLDSSGTVLGHWDNVKSRYLGLEFVVNGKRHYGWARLSVKVRKYHITGTLTGYAYETIPNKPIIAGKTHGKDVVTVQDPSLGHLARGASAVPAWRAKESK